MGHVPRWPVPACPSTPFADAHWEAFGDGWGDYARRVGALPSEREAYAHDATRLRRGLDGVDQAAGRWDPALDELVVRLRLDGPVRLGRLSSEPPPTQLPSPADLARLCLDLDPAAGADGPDQLLGRWADLVARPHDTDVIACALGQYLYASAHGQPQSPFERWRGRRPLPTVPIRAQFRAVARAPVGLYEVVSRGGAGWELRSLTPLPSPPGPVRCRPACLSSLPTRAVSARVTPCGDQLVASCALGVPNLPSDQAVASWLRLLLLRARLVHRGVTWVDLLCARGHVLSRRLVDGYTR